MAFLLALAAAVAHTVGASEVSRREACRCLNWKTLYDSLEVACGEGLELYEMVKPRTNLSLKEATFFWVFAPFQYYEFCGSFFKRMDNNHCVNVGMHEYGTQGLLGEQWCYVSDACTELNGGQPISQKESYSSGLDWLAMVPLLPAWLGQLIAQGLEYMHSPRPVRRRLSWKLCTRGQDSRLRDMAPSDLLELARGLDSVIGYVTKIAYPRLLPPDTWDRVKAAVAAGDIQSMPEALQRAIAAKVPIVVDVDPEGHTHQRILRGTEVYELEQNCTTRACSGEQWPFRRGRDIGEL